MTDVPQTHSPELLRDLELLQLRAINAELRAALKSCRLMMHAWRGARLNLGLPDDHYELIRTIDAIDIAIAKAEQEVSP